jgi:Autographiviridae endonuclease VII
VEDFHRSKSAKDGRQPECKVCQKARMSTPRMIEKRRRNAWLACLRKFSITEDDYNKMFDEQMGLCAICHKPENDIKLAVDHDHETGRVRGLLCKRCNMGIGLLGDNPDTLINATLYLRRTQNG